MKKKFVWIGVFLTLVVGGFAFVALRTQATRDAAAGLAEARREARQFGLPTSMEEVPNVEVGESANAAPLILEAAVTDDPAKKAELYFQAAQRRALAFDWSKAQHPGFWDEVKFQEGTAALLDAAERDFKTGDVREFRLRLNAALDLARLAASVPTEEAFRQSIMAERTCYERLGELMVAHHADRQLMPEVQAAVFEARNVKSLLTALRRFVALGNEIAQNREMDGDQKLAWLWSQGDFPTDPWGRDAVEATHLAAATRLMKELDRADGWSAASATIEDAVEEWRADERPVASTLREHGAGLDDLPKLAQENEAARRILFVAAAAFRSRHEKGMFPSESPVKGEMELDPFRLGTPMAFSNPGTGFYLYSIGRDALDSAGTAEEGLTFGLDIGFKFRSWGQGLATQPSPTTPN
jgi:hypothetical protein